MSATGFKQNQSDIGYYVTLGSLISQVYIITAGSGNTGTLNPTVSTVSWAAPNLAGGLGVPVSTIKASGAILKDLGKTVVSSSRTFRKVQLMLPNVGGTSTFGVAGQNNARGDDYLTGYIELGFDGQGTPAAVAHFGR